MFSIGKNVNTSKRKNFVTKFKVPALPFPLNGTSIRSIKAVAMAIKIRQMYISCLSLFIVKLYDPSSVFLRTHDTASI